MSVTVRSHRALVIALALLAALLGPFLGAAPAGAAVPDLYLSQLTANGSLVQPVGIVGSRNGSHRLYVLERRGTVRMYDALRGRLLSGYFLDLRSVVRDSGGEQGLLGLAFDPRYRSGRPYVYASYTDSTGALRVVRLRASSASAYSVSASTRRTVLTVPHPTYQNHNAGQLLFNGGLLFIGTGDGGGAGDPARNAQDRTSLSRKILRLDVSRSCAGRLYCVPAGNPYATSGTYRREVWAYGVRNPWRFSADRATGTLWIADVGQDRYEEVTVVRRTTPGRNLGWSCVEGRVVFNGGCAGRTLTAPRYVYSHAAGESVIGGYVYRGATYRSLIGGRYVFGDFVSGAVWRTTSTGTLRREATLPRVTAFGESEYAELFAVTYDGALYRVRAR